MTKPELLMPAGNIEKLKYAILYIKKLRKYYKFNTLGLFAVGFKMKVRADKSFYCAEFVKHVLEEANIETKLPDLVKPEDFKLIKNLKLEYYGLFKFYKYQPNMMSLS